MDITLITEGTYPYHPGGVNVGFSWNDRPEPTGLPVLWALFAAPALYVFFGLAFVAILSRKFYGVLFAAAGCAFMAAAADRDCSNRTSSFARSMVGCPSPGPGDALMVARYFGLGIFSGLLVSIFIVLEPAQSGAHGWPAVAAYPLVLSLGVMEWQLHSLRAGARNALVASGSLGDFARASRRKLAVATLSYFAVLAVLTGWVQGLAYSHGVHTNWALLVAGTALALAFFLALVVGACGRIDVVLRAWLPGLVIYGAWGVAERVTQPSWASDARLAFCVAAVVSLVAMAGAAVRVVANPVCHG